MSDWKVNRTALVDADYLAYHTAAWAQGNDGDTMDMVDRMTAHLSDWISRAFCTDAILLTSCGREDNFRKDFYPLYKSHRTGSPPPLLDDAKQALKNLKWMSLSRPRIEADDCIGILMTNGRIENPVCITRDKDLRQVPGWHFNPFDEDFPVFVTEEGADMYFVEQWMTGDPSDGFPGLKGIGPARAEKVIAEYGWDWNVLVGRVFDMYEEQGKNRNEALAQARCARILRAGDWDAEKQAPIPWEPHIV